MADLVVYGTKMSPFVRKVEAVLQEKALAYDFEAVNIGAMPDWYKEISPLRRIPTLRDRTIGADGVAGTIADSSAICGFLERKCPSPALYPADAFDYGRALWLEEYADTGMAATGGFGIVRALIFPRFEGKDPDIETARDTWHNKMPRYFDYLEKTLNGEEFFVGNAFSIADIAVASQLLNFDLFVGPPDAARWPGLARFVVTMRNRPCFQANLTACRETIAPLLDTPVALT